MELTFGYSRTSMPGTVAIEAWGEWVSPLGIVWYRFLRNGRDIELLHSFVVESHRRNGIRTAMHKEMIRAYPSVERILTDGGSATGLKWLKATGFKWQRNQWVLNA